MGQVTTGHTLDVGHQVVGDTLGILTDQAWSVGSYRVEVSQADSWEVTLLGLDGVFEDLLDHGLGLAIWVSGLDAWIFSRGLLFTVESGRRREHYVLAAVLEHTFDQADWATHVVLVVFEGLSNALTNSFETSEVDHSGDLGMTGKTVIKFGLIADIYLLKGDQSIAVASDLLDSF
jgi:hypothetical protein